MRRGLTLIEVVIVIGLSIGILLVLARFATIAVLMKNLVKDKLQVTQDVEQAFQVVVTDIRSMGQSSAGAYPLEAATTSSIIFFSDIDVDGVFERVRYTIETSTLTKGVVEPTGSPLVYATSSEVVSMVIPNIIGGSSSMAYFDAAYTGTSTTPLGIPIDPLAVRVVRLAIVAEVTATSSPQPRLFDYTVTPRNLRSN